MECFANMHYEYYNKNIACKISKSARFLTIHERRIFGAEAHAQQFPGKYRGK